MAIFQEIFQFQADGFAQSVEKVQQLLLSAHELLKNSIEHPQEFERHKIKLPHNFLINLRPQNPVTLDLKNPILIQKLVQSFLKNGKRLDYFIKNKEIDLLIVSLGLDSVL